MACDPTTIAQQAICIDKNIPDGMKLAVVISLLCQIVANGGTGGGASILYGTGNPNGVVNGTTTATTTQLYIDFNTGIIYAHTGIGTSNTGWV